MPAAEAMAADERDVLSYELAFHVLPTVAEGEVTTIFDSIKALITNAGGELIGEEAPARFELAYEIVKYLEGRNRKFSSAYFGWVRFKLDPSQVDEIAQEVEAMKEILRSMVIRLTKIEEENPFEFHPSVASRMSETIEIGEETEVEEGDDADEASAAPAETEESSEEETDGGEEEKAV